MAVVKKTNISTIIIVIISLIVLAILLFFAVKLMDSNNNEEEVSNDQVIRVIDGDTFELNGETIRLLCVDTPEQGKAGYQEATDYLSSLILNREVILRDGLSYNSMDKDVYNRSLRFVYIDVNSNQLFVNKNIVDNGYGKLYSYNGTNCSLLG